MLFKDCGNVNITSFLNTFSNIINMVKSYKSFGRVVYNVIEKSDIILEILDARFIDETRNYMIEHKIENEKKILIHVINKCDFVSQKFLEKEKKHLENCVFVSAKKHLGTKMLKEKIMILARRNKIKDPIVGVVGYPNVGKSSVINALKGKQSARISPEAGFTRGMQLVRISREMMMVDTPGIMPRDETNDFELVKLGAKKPESISDPDLAVHELMKEHPGLMERHYGVEICVDKDKTLGKIADKFNLKIKGNLPDIHRVSKKILFDWQNGKIRR